VFPRIGVSYYNDKDETILEPAQLGFRCALDLVIEWPGQQILVTLLYITRI